MNNRTSIFVILFTLIQFPLGATVSASQTPLFVATAPDLGRAPADRMMKIRVWFKLRNGDLFERTLADLYDRNSPNFHHWISHETFRSLYLPTEAQRTLVEHFLASRGLAAASDSAEGNQMYMEVSARTDAIEKAFQIEIHDFLVKGKKIFANTSDPVLDPAISALVLKIGGLNDHRMRHLHLGSPNGIPVAEIPAPRNGKGPFGSACFQKTKTINLPTANGVAATYSGNQYGEDLIGTSQPYVCGYGPATLSRAYGLDPLFAQGIDGSGQTVVILGAWGSPTLESDNLAFTTLYGISPISLTTYALGSPPVGGWNADEQEWAVEMTLDTQSAHVFAPGAQIAVVAAASDSDDDLAAAIDYPVEHPIAQIMSGSFGDYESDQDPGVMPLYDQILKSGSIQGISAQFGSGDYGDGVTQMGYADSFYPSSSPYATSVGGTSLGVNPDGSVQFHVGWGNNIVDLSTFVPSAQPSDVAQSQALNAPTLLGFFCGAGGGSSRTYAKPSFQRALPGSRRMTPDVAYLADMFTGIEIVKSHFDSSGNPIPNSQTVDLYGGTSLSTPIFSAVWAVAEQAAGQSLGQASQAVYDLPKRAFIDVVPLGSDANVSGSVTSAAGTTAYTALNLGTPETEAPFISGIAFMNAYIQGNLSYAWQLVTFGTDSSLSTQKGWDAVTGLGVPNGSEFVNALIWSETTGSSAGETNVR